MKPEIYNPILAAIKFAMETAAAVPNSSIDKAISNVPGNFDLACKMILMGFRVT